MLSLYKDLIRFKPIFSQVDRSKIFILFCLTCVSSLLEIFGLGLIAGFFALLGDPSSLADKAFIGNWLPNLPEEPSVSMALWGGGILFLFFTFKNLLTGFVFYTQANVAAGIFERISRRVFQAFQLAPFEWILQSNTSKLIRNIYQDTSRVATGFMMPLIDLTMSTILMASIVCVIIFTMPKVVLISMFLCGIGMFLVMYIFRQKLRKTAKIMRHESQGIIQLIQENFGAFVETRIGGRESYFGQIHRNRIRRFARSIAMQNAIQKMSPYVMETILVFGIIVIFCFFTLSWGSLTEALPLLALIAVGSMRLKQIASRITAAVHRLNMSREHALGLVEDMVEIEKMNTKVGTPQATGLIGKFQDLRMEQVNYSYPGSKELILNALSFDLKRGESIAFLGATGSGKSTLINVLLGLLEPQSGKVYVNEVDILRDLSGWRSMIGYVPQTIYLLDASIYANVAFGVQKNKINKEKVWYALEKAHVAEFVKSLPEGGDTYVGERGARLSGGQRQRLGIARALYREPEVLILDEATSALDGKTEQNIISVIREFAADKQTLITITHRMSTVEACDRIYYLNNGFLEASGTYQELGRKSAEFAKMALFDPES